MDRRQPQQLVPSLRSAPRPQNNTANNGISDSGHQHPLQHDRNHSFATCDQCKEIWMGKMYRCPLPNCNYSVHEYCASPFVQPIATVHFYNDCVFTPGGKSNNLPYPICNACGLNIRGWIYKCTKSHPHPCQRTLHPSCVLFQTLELQGNKFSVERGPTTSKCLYCDKLELWRGDRTWWFVSSVDSTHRIHVSCAKKMLIKYTENLGETSNNNVTGLRASQYGVTMKMGETSNNNARGLRASQYAVSRVAEVEKRKGVKVLKAAGRILMLFLSVLLGDPTKTPVVVYDLLVN